MTTNAWTDWADFLTACRATGAADLVRWIEVQMLERMWRLPC